MNTLVRRQTFKSIIYPLWGLLLGLILLIHLSASAQNPVEMLDGTEKSLAAVKSLINGLESLNLDLVEKRLHRSNKDLSEVEQKGIDGEIDSLNKAIADQRANFDSVVTGLDLDEFNGKSNEAVVLEAELRQLIEPFVRELRKATARPRETEQLRETLSTLRAQEAMALEAVANLTKLLRKADDNEAKVKSALQTELENWNVTLNRAEDQLSVAEFQLEERLRKEQTIFGTLKGAFSSFFRTRGRNAFGAIALGLATFVVLRLIHRLVHRLSPIKKRRKRSLAIRLVDVTYYLFTVTMAVIVALGGLYLMGDWMLLGLSLVLLTGLLWAGKHSISVFFEQVRLMLNLGSTREGERILYNGIPWTVRSIKLYCDLENPQLRGGSIRLPLRDIVTLVSREADADEFLFPCNEGDWVLLSDGVLGKVLQQTPEWVQLVLLGGSRKNYATADFVGLNLQNLSTGFRLQSFFGVDYQHQAESTSVIPAQMQEFVDKGLCELVNEDELIHLRVELTEAAASSINYAVIADFAGNAAPKFGALERAIQRLCVDACNAHGWTIPFTQIMLHQAVSSTPTT